MGYAGGNQDNPTYNNIKDHTEVIAFDYDDEMVSYSELLDIFFASHSYNIPIYNNQYKSLVLYTETREYDIIMEKIDEINQAKHDDVYTEVIKLDRFYLAEKYHQKFYLQNTMDIMMEFEKRYPKFKNFVDSTNAAHVNGYIKGYKTLDNLLHDKHVDLSEQGFNRLKSIVQSYS